MLFLKKDMRMKWMKEASATGAKLEKIRQQLQALAGRARPAGEGRGMVSASATPAAGGQTISDDSPLPPDKVAAVKRDEELVRGALALFGIAYDDLIAMRDAAGQPTAYAQAVQANPALLSEVPDNPQPVLAALRIALGFKPYAEFAQRYGQTPDAVKEAIRAEMASEMKASGTAEPALKAALAPVFSGNRAGAGRASAKRAKATLADVFER